MRQQSNKRGKTVGFKPASDARENVSRKANTGFYAKSKIGALDHVSRRGSGGAPEAERCCWAAQRLDAQAAPASHANLPSKTRASSSRVSDARKRSQHRPAVAYIHNRVNLSTRILSIRSVSKST